MMSYPKHQYDVGAYFLGFINFKQKKRQDRILSFLEYGGGEETRTLTPCGAGT